MTTSSPSQHDSLFKKFLSDIAVARDFLEAHLPPHLRERCDFSTLAMESGSFIEDDLSTEHPEYGSRSGFLARVEDDKAIGREKRSSQRKIMQLVFIRKLYT